MKLLFFLTFPALAVLWHLMPDLAGFLVFFMAFLIIIIAVYLLCLHTYAFTARLFVDVQVYRHEKQLTWPNVDGAMPLRTATLASGAMDMVVLHSNAMQAGARYGRVQSVQPLPQPAMPQSQPVPPLLDVIRGRERLLNVGGSGVGKTVTTLHILNAMQRDGYALTVCDPKGIAPWPVEPIGAGGHFDLIAKGVWEYWTEVKDRYERITRLPYQQRASAVAALERRLLVVDEWYNIVKDDDGSKAAPALKKILTLGREVGCGIVLVGHDLTVEALGMKGEGGLRNSFDCLVQLKKEGNAYKAFADVGTGMIEVQHPGPYLPAPAAEPHIITGMYTIPRERWEKEISHSNVPENTGKDTPEKEISSYQTLSQAITAQPGYSGRKHTEYKERVLEQIQRGEIRIVPE